MKLEVLSCAEGEFAEAVEHYNRQLPGLGYEFAAEVKASFERISSFPNAWPPFSSRSRRCMLNRFPYGVLYCINPDVILAIMDLCKDPMLWQERVRKAAP